jgi:uncharacterized protein (TIGR03067 family)
VDKQQTQQTSLPARPNLEHLRGQAKKVLEKLSKNSKGDRPKLSDAQLIVAREAGFSSWPRLVKHVETLRSLEGDWRIARLEVDGHETPATYLERTRILMDGDRFRTESPEGTYEGRFAIDTEASPPHFDIHFIAGPDAGNTSHGIYRIDSADELVLCLGLVGSPRPKGFATKAGSGSALEHLRRASTARPDNVTGGTPPPSGESREISRGNAADFAHVDSPLLRQLQGAWNAVELVMGGKPMPEQWLAHGKRTMADNHVTVVFGGQKMVDAKVHIDESVSPVAIDYFHLSGTNKGAVTYGILDWQGDDARFVMATAGEPRPTSFDPPAKGTLSRWRRS